jgi:hypothetical protein
MLASRYKCRAEGLDTISSSPNRNGMPPPAPLPFVQARSPIAKLNLILEQIESFLEFELSVENIYDMVVVGKDA